MWEWKGLKTTISHKEKTRSLGDLPYIGFTQASERRFGDEVFSDALQNYAEGIGLTLHDQAILKALKLEKNNIFKKINEIDRCADLDPRTSDLSAVYHWYESSISGHAKELRTFIMSKKIIRKYFNIKLKEIHNNQQGALDSEKELTRNYKHSVDEDIVEGTVWPKGLNMRLGGSGAKTGASYIISSNFIDVIALTSLGFKLNTIAKIMSRVYKIDISESLLSTFIGNTEYESFSGLQDEVLKPIVWEMLNDLNIGIEEMVDILPFAQRIAFDKRVAQWFKGSIADLRKIIKGSHMDSRQIKEYISDGLDIFRGRAPSELKELLLKSSKPHEDLALFLGFSKTTSREVVFKISQFFTGQDMTAKGLQRVFRKEECIFLLRRGISPEVILDEYFGLKIWSNRAGRDKIYLDKSIVRYHLEYIFKDSHLDFEEIIRAYHCNPSRTLSRYKHGSVILKE